MKKVLVAVALMMGLGTVYAVESSVKAEISVVQEDVYKEVKLEDLNEKVQATIKGYEDTYTVKSLGYNEEKEQTKVTLTAKDDSGDKEVILDNEGKEI